MGVTPVLFRDLDDSEFLAAAASEHDIVIHTASGFHLGSALALVAGLGARKKATGSLVHYVHVKEFHLSNMGFENLLTRPQTSGTWSLGYSDGPLFVSGVPLSDTNDMYGFLKMLEAHSSNQQRKTLLETVDRSELEGVEAHCLLPPDVYGFSLGPFHRQPPFAQDLIRGCLERGRPEFVEGSGTGYVCVRDLADLYVLIVRRIVEGKEVPSGRKGILFAEMEYRNWLQVAFDIGSAGTLLEIWEADSRPVSISVEEAAQKWSWDVEDVRNSFGPRYVPLWKRRERNADIVKVQYDLGCGQVVGMVG